MAVTPEVLPDNQVQVLDHGFVRLDDAMADDLSVVNGARVSFARRKEEMEESDEGLIRFLMRERHGTPFEHNSFRFHIRAPIFVAREWFRHRVGSFNEFSMRYAKATDEFYVPEPEDVRTQVGKPGSYSFEAVSPEIAETTRDELRAVYEAAYETYEKLVELGVARELARCVLPVGAYTEFYWTVNARALMNFLSLRAAETAQREIRRYAEACEVFLAERMPVTYAAFVANERTRLGGSGASCRRSLLAAPIASSICALTTGTVLWSALWSQRAISSPSKFGRVVRDREAERRRSRPADVEAPADHDRLAVLRHVEDVVVAGRKLPQALDLEEHRRVAVRVARAETDDRLRLVVRERDRPDGLEGLARVLVAGEVSADEREQCDRGCEGERRADAAAGEPRRLQLADVASGRLEPLRARVAVRAAGRPAISISWTRSRRSCSVGGRPSPTRSWNLGVSLTTALLPVHLRAGKAHSSFAF